MKQEIKTEMNKATTATMLAAPPPMPTATHTNVTQRAPPPKLPNSVAMKVEKVDPKVTKAQQNKPSPIPSRRQPTPQQQSRPQQQPQSYPQMAFKPRKKPKKMWGEYKV